MSRCGRIVSMTAKQAVEPGFDSPRRRLHFPSLILLFQHCKKNHDVIRKNLARKKVAQVKKYEGNVSYILMIKTPAKLRLTGWNACWKCHAVPWPVMLVVKNMSHNMSHNHLKDVMFTCVWFLWNKKSMRDHWAAIHCFIWSAFFSQNWQLSIAW